MNSNQYDFGMIGLGVMGRNFILNVADHGFSAIGLDTDEEPAKALEAEAGDQKVKGTTSMQEFVRALHKPRRIMLLVPAGKVVDSVIENLLPLLDEGDLIVDGGNSHFDDTTRRAAYLKSKSIYFLGTGVSGGAEGARTGPSIMPGGDKTAYAIIRPVLEAVAAKVNGEPCVAYMGEGAAGHYVKMVHNGIEYGLMQLIAESYSVLRLVGGLSNEELHEVFAKWNQGRLSSFLIEITAAIFSQKDDLTEGWLVDNILDKAKQKGTGKWTSQNAMDLGIPIPTIDAAVTMRGLSALKKERVDTAKVYPAADKGEDLPEKNDLIAIVEQSLYLAYILTYAQGLSLLTEASKEHGYNSDLEAIARIWRGGCIIRAALLEKIRKVYSKDPELNNLLLSDEFDDEVKETHSALRKLLKIAIDQGIPLMAFGSALHYFDAFRSEVLPLNLVQAQRDYFGSHTFERIDQEGVFHSDWGLGTGTVAG